MVADRIAENLLTILILAFMGWIIYKNTNGNDSLANFRDSVSRFTGGNKDGRFKRN